MCGRYLLASPGEVIAEHFRLAAAPVYPPRYNIAPTFTIVTTNANEQTRALHERMPALVAPADYDEWLSSPNPSALLAPAP